MNKILKEMNDFAISKGYDSWGELTNHNDSGDVFRYTIKLIQLVKNNVALGDVRLCPKCGSDEVGAPQPYTLICLECDNKFN